VEVVWKRGRHPATDVKGQKLALESDPPSVEETVEHVRFLASELSDYIKSLEGEVEQAVADAAALSAHLTVSARERQLFEAAMKSRAEVRRRSDQRRWQELLKPLQARDEAARRTLALYPNPEAMLVAAGLGSNERLQLEEGIQLLDEKSLLDLARLAIATNNCMLGAALLTINTRRPLERRAFSSSELAAALMGAEHSALVERALRVSEALKASLERNRQFELGCFVRKSTTRAISHEHFTKRN
jgi:hypothetical protein